MVLQCIPFFLYAATHSFFFSMAIKQTQRGHRDKHPITWMIWHYLVMLGYVAVIIDCIRIGMGAFWTTESMPWIASIVWWPSITTHLLLVGWYTCQQAEFCIAVRTWKKRSEGASAEELAQIVLADTTMEIWIRRITFVITAPIMGFMVVNVSSIIRYFLVEGWTSTEMNGIVTWRTPPLADAHAAGYPEPVPELLGVITYAVVAWLAGICIWKRTGWSVYFWITLIGLFGQGFAGPLPQVAFWTSNLFEIFSFAGMVLASEQLLRLDPIDPALKDGSELGAVEGAMVS